MANKAYKDLTRLYPDEMLPTDLIAVEAGLGNELESKRLTLGDLFNAASLDIDVSFASNTLFIQANTHQVSVNGLPSANTSDKFTVHGDTYVYGSIHATGEIVADGDLVLGDEDTDTITFNADITSNIIPNAHSTYYLGSDTKYWQGVYTRDAFVKRNLDVQGNTNVAGIFTVDSDFIANTDLFVDVSEHYVRVSALRVGSSMVDPGSHNLYVEGDITLGGGDLTVSTSIFNIANATATTVNAFGAATDIQIGSSSGTTNINNSLDVDGDVNIDGGDLTTNLSSMRVFNTSATTINAFGAATDIQIGASTGTTNINNSLDVDGDVNIDGGDLTVSAATFNIANATATTVNAFGAATDIQIGASTGTTNINNSLDVDGDLNIDGGDLTVSTSTFNIANATATTVNAFGAATDIQIGASTGTTNINNSLDVDGDLNIDGGDLTVSTSTFNIANANALTVGAFKSGTDIEIGALTGKTTIRNANTNVSGVLTVNQNTILKGDLEVRGGDLTTTATTFNVFNTSATTVNAFGAATNIQIGSSSGTTNINNNLDVDGDVNIDGGDLTVSTSTFNIANATATTVNAFGAATNIQIGSSTGTTTVRNNAVISKNLTVTGNLTINGSTTTIESTVVAVEDADFVLRKDAIIAGSGGFIVTSGSGPGQHRTFQWDHSQNRWELDENTNVQGELLVNETVSVVGNAQFSSNVNVTGNVTIQKTLDVTNSTDLHGLLTVYGQSTFNSNVQVLAGVEVLNNVSVTGEFTVGANAYFLEETITDGNAWFSSNVNVTGNVTIQKTLDVSANTDLHSWLNVDGNAQFSNNVNVSGDVQLDADVSIDGYFTQDGRFAQDVNVTGNVTANTFFTSTHNSNNWSEAFDAVDLVSSVSNPTFLIGTPTGYAAAEIDNSLNTGIEVTWHESTGKLEFDATGSFIVSADVYIDSHWILYDDTSNTQGISISSDNTIAIAPSGHVRTIQGIGSVAGGYTHISNTALSVWGNIYSGGNVTVQNDLTVGGSITETSDVRLKYDIEKIENAVLKVSQLNGYTFLKKNSEKRSSGVIAQEVEKVLPEVINTDKDGYLSVSYANMVGLLIEAIKEQQNEITELKNFINRL